MNRFSYCLFICALFACASRMCDATPAQAVTMRTQTVEGVTLRVIDADLGNPNVHIAAQIASSFPGNAESFSTLVNRSKPTAAINGAYFSKENLSPIGDIVIRGHSVHRGDFKTALVITGDNRAYVRRHNLAERVDWSSYDTVLCCGPALVLDGKIDWEPDAQNHHDPHVTGAVSRMGVGITPDNHLLLVAASGSMDFARWSRVMKGLGCRDAMNLDSGASRALYYRGNYLVQPGRDLTNLLLIYDTTPVPDYTILAPLRGSSSVTTRISRPPVILPKDDLDGVNVRICSESGKKASDWCPSSVPRRLRSNHIPTACPLHKPPPGER